MQFQVPQFIETEDHIVGPFTIRQFAYIAAGGGLSFMLYFAVATWLWVFLSIFLVGGAFSFAFVKISGRPLSRIVLSAFNFYWKPQTYVWQPEHPEIEKNVRSLTPVAEHGIQLESIVSGMALQGAWQNLQTGTKVSNEQFFGKVQERYQVFRQATGDRAAAKRIDYR